MSRGVVVVTGGARGQGAAHAELLCREGYRVVLADLLDDDGAALALRLRDEGGSAEYHRLDVGSEDGWAVLAQRLSEAEAPVAGLVNNAGILRHAPIAETTADSWLLQQRVNSLGAFLGIRAIAPLIAEGGAIVNVSSTAALVGAAGYAAYSASKAALIALTRVAAVEYAPRLRVNAICPGGVSTAMNDDEPAGGSSAATPLGRRAAPTEISPLISYLLSDRASFVTGAVLPIDGGLTAL